MEKNVGKIAVVKERGPRRRRVKKLRDGRREDRGGEDQVKWPREKRGEGGS
jgi:hypothetical protein